jgi:uncharacterized protein (DUF305 family)
MKSMNGWLVAGLVLVGCAKAPPATTPDPAAPMTPAELARQTGGIAPFTPADVRFMNGMIAHHAQAIIMARWAPTHGARADVQRLAARIEVSQRDEIALMQTWLRDRKQPVPDPMAAAAMGHSMAEHAGHAMGDTTLHPGMLTAAELARLDAARGAEFDRLFLTYMIKHHQGAITMVHELMASPGAAQDVVVFQFASEVESDQMVEIERMTQMLAASRGGI